MIRTAQKAPEKQKPGPPIKFDPKVNEAIAAAQKIEEPKAREAAFREALDAIRREGIVPV